MQLEKAVDGRQGLGLVAGLVVGIGLFQLGLLRQRRSGGAPLEFLEQRDRLVIRSGTEFVLRFSVDLVRTPVRRLVVRRRGTRRQQRRGSQCQGGNGR
jgi:hypothetical protein